MLTITATELKLNTGKYLVLIEKEDIAITRNGKQIAKLVSTKIDKSAIAESLFGILPKDVNAEDAKEGRLKKYEIVD